MSKKLEMRYFSPAESTNDGWEKYSIPIGNGYFGASVYGGYDRERIQFTTNTFANDFSKGGVCSFGEILIDFKDIRPSDYVRGLSLNTGVAYSNYKSSGSFICRKAFASYPDKVFAYKISSKEKTLDFDVSLVIPYLNDRPAEEGGRSGELGVDNGVLVMRGTLPSRELIYEARLAIITDGTVKTENTMLKISNSAETVLLYTLDTSYRLCPEVFMDGYHKALGDDPHKRVIKCLENALNLGWDKLYERHIADYTGLIDRVEVDLGGTDDGRATDELLDSYKAGNSEPYLEELYYAYGRHLLVSSSRKGTPPASLQGVWTIHDRSPWSCGFWHNINVQMNYWPAFNTNLAETFSAYADYWKNYVKQAQASASGWIEKTNPENFVADDGECGWIIGTGGWMYEIEGMSINTHSGPGTGGMTSKMFWDYYDFTRDENVLKEYTYPCVHGMAKFLTKSVRNYDGKYLCSFSASPEQILSGDWVTQHKEQQYYHTVGCAFDQQFIYENACDDIKCADILHVSDSTVETEKQQLSAYDPVQIGYSGQIKEYGEENFYGEIGEARHRHISQLVGVVPGSSITHSTPAWLDAAKITLNLRGDKSTGWALAHRFCAWARIGDGNHSYSLLQNLLRERTYPNLWDIHPPFQIDGNFGATAGITEMLLQSHEGYVSLLPAIPDEWKNISFRGLKARGNFTVSCKYRDEKITRCEIKSDSGGKLILRYEGISKVTVTEKESGCRVVAKCSDLFVEFETQKGITYVIDGFEPVKKRPIVTELISGWLDDGVHLKWEATGDKYAIYRAKDSDSEYTLVGITNKREFTDAEYTASTKARLTYKVVICTENSYDSSLNGALTVLNPSSRLEQERYALKLAVNRTR